MPGPRGFYYKNCDGNGIDAFSRKMGRLLAQLKLNTKENGQAHVAKFVAIVKKYHGVNEKVFSDALTYAIMHAPAVIT